MLYLKLLKRCHLFGVGISDKGNALISEIGGAVSSATGIAGALASFVPGPWGLVVGGAVGLAQVVKGVNKAIGTIGSGFVKAAEQAKEEFTKLQGAIQQYTSTFSDLAAAAENTETAPKTLIRLQRKLNKLLLDIPSEFRGDILGISDPKELQSRIAEILEEQTKIQVQAEITGNLSKKVNFRDSNHKTVRNDYGNLITYSIK